MDERRSGWDHFAAAEWAAARDAFEATLAERPGDPEALDGLGQSLWWLGDRDAGIDRRRAAYAEFQRRGKAATPPAWRSTSPASTGSTAATPRARAGSRGLGPARRQRAWPSPSSAAARA